MAKRTFIDMCARYLGKSWEPSHPKEGLDFMWIWGVLHGVSYVVIPFLSLSYWFSDVCVLL